MRYDFSSAEEGRALGAHEMCEFTQSEGSYGERYWRLEESAARVEAQTQQAEDELRAIVDNAPVFLWSDLADGYCDFLNQPWLELFQSLPWRWRKARAGRLRFIPTMLRIIWRVGKNQ